MEFCRNLLALLLVMVCMGASTRGNGLVRVKAGKILTSTSRHTF